MNFEYWVQCLVSWGLGLVLVVNSLLIKTSCLMILQKKKKENDKTGEKN